MIVRTARFAELDAPTLYQLLHLRCDVFVVEQECAYPELDGRDTEPGTVHCWLESDGDPVAYLRVLVEPDGGRRIGRVCTAKSHRRLGLADRLLAHALERADHAGTWVLDAQTDAIALYLRHGFVVSGEPFVEDGIEHLPMRRATEVSRT